MLKVRIIPTLLWKDLGLVKGVAFDSWRRIGTIMPAVKVYNTRQVDELMLLDITATEQERDPDYETINEIAAECFVPLTVGGGIRNIEQIRELLRAGADKVCINSAAFETPELISEATGKFGAQCVVVSIDVAHVPEGGYECVSRAGKRRTGKEPGQWARTVMELGAGEILLTSVERDGTMQGYDINLIKRVAGLVDIPVIAAGGAGNYQHMFEAITDGNASAIAAASIFHFTEQTPLEAKKYLSNKGIPVRNINLKYS